YAKETSLLSSQNFPSFESQILKILSSTPFSDVLDNKYQVFLIYRGSDVKETLVDHLFKSLGEAGVKVAEIDLDKHKTDLEGILFTEQAREDTTIRIPILSMNVKQPLLSLKQLLRKHRPKFLLRPLFYDEEPIQNIQNLHGDLPRYDLDISASSRGALPQESLYTEWSWSLENSRNAQQVKRIVFDILQMLNILPLHAVAMEKNIAGLMENLNMDSEDSVVTVAICGIGGVGKTTLAKALFNKIGSRFQACSFVPNPQATEICKLQEQILRDLSRQDISVKNVEHGKALMKTHLASIQALVILDGIDCPIWQEEAFSAEWLAPGSRLILTSRDHQLFAHIQEDRIYQMGGLENEHGIELLSWHAFLRSYPDDGYRDMSKRIVNACHGIPLLLEVVGASLYGKKGMRCWDESIKYLESTEDICKGLSVSYLNLDFQEREIFLDIVCFFSAKENIETTSSYWEASGFTPYTALESLILKCLIRVDDRKQFIVHDYVQDMGRAMVVEESPYMGKRSRLWKPEDAVQVIKSGLGTESVRAIYISGAENNNIILQAERLAPMSKLQLLWMDGEIVGDFRKLPPDLIWLRWNSCPLRCLPSEWSMERVAVLDLSSMVEGPPSELRELWNESSCKGFYKNLKVLRLNFTQYLAKLPDMSNCTSLSMLDLQQCSKLRNLPNSFSFHLGGLKCLNLSGCRNLEELPSSIFKHSSLERLLLRHCFSLKLMPNTVNELTTLKELDIGFLEYVEELPAFHRLFDLEKLILTGCSSIRTLPDSIKDLNNLKELDVQFLGLIQELPPLSNLLYLNRLILSGCASLRELPTSIGTLRYLQYLEMNGCRSISGLPETFGDLFSLEELFMNNCSRLVELPENLGKLVSLKTLELKNNSNLMSLPSSFSQLRSLVLFDASNCNLLDGLPAQIGDILALGILNLENILFFEMPSSIGNLAHLTKLNLNECKSLEEIQTLPKGLVELDVGNCRLLRMICDMSHLEQLKILILCNCENLVRFPNLSSCKSLSILNISGCINFRSLAGVEGLRSLETFQFGGSGVSVLDLRKMIIVDMPRLQEVSIYANEIPQCLKHQTRDHCLNGDNFKEIIFSPVENNLCEGVLLCFVVNFMGECQTNGHFSQNVMEISITGDNQEALWSTILSNRQKAEGDQLYICIYRENHPFARKLGRAGNIHVGAKGSNIQIRKCGMQLLYDGIGDEIFERLEGELCLLVKNYTVITDEDEIEGRFLPETKDEEDDDMNDYGYDTSE
ncbi:hypothetical protein KI387_021305, partial [Taxus chinensis]